MWHVLALALGGRTIAEWQASMTKPEFLCWVEFYKLNPFDDFHRLYRPAALIARSLGGGDMNQILEWLAPEPVPEGYTQADLNTLKALGSSPQKRKA